MICIWAFRSNCYDFSIALAILYLSKIMESSAHKLWLLAQQKLQKISAVAFLTMLVSVSCEVKYPLYTLLSSIGLKSRHFERG